MKVALPVFCLLILHAPDGSQIVVENNDLRAIRQITPQYHDHLPKGTHSVIYLGVRPNGFGIYETVEDIESKIKACEDKH